MPQRAGKDADSRALARIQRLMKQAILGDEVAAEVLSTIATIAAASLAEATSEQPAMFRKMAMESPIWPTLHCKAPNLKGYYDTQIEMLQIGKKLKATSTSHLTLESDPAFIATHAAHYLQDVRSGLLGHPNEIWLKAVRALPPLNQKSVLKWWPLAAAEIGRSFPELHDRLRGKNINPATLGQAIQLVRRPFLQTWKLLEFITV